MTPAAKIKLHRKEIGSAIAALTAIILSFVAFTVFTLPTPPGGLKILSINAAIFESMAHMLARDWTIPLWPAEYEMKRIYWWPATLYPTYFIEKWIGPLKSYLLFASAFITASFAAAYYFSRSLLFAATMAFMFAFGTQLNYIYTNGTLVILYLILIYCTVNISILILLVNRSINRNVGYPLYVLTLLLVALSSEWWINYGVLIIGSSTFAAAWARHHRDSDLYSLCKFLIISTTLTLVIYLAIRLQYPAQLTRHGEEEELILTYRSRILFIEDVIVNFFTFLYQVLTNYFPSFITSSNSLTYVGSARIIAEQHGYHAEYQNLVLMSHIFMWRFYAGISTTLFFIAFGFVLIRSFKTKDRFYFLVAVMMVAVLVSFGTHLTIKMRPYNSVPALPYKVVFSVSAFTVLIAYLVMTFSEQIKSLRWRRAMVGGVWLCVAFAAVTRPGMHARLLEQVGLYGLRDPAAQILSSPRRP